MGAVNSPIMHDKRLGDVHKRIVTRRVAEGKDGGSRGDAGHLLAHTDQMGTYRTQNRQMTESTNQAARSKDGLMLYAERWNLAIRNLGCFIREIYLR